eukprot:4977087-Pyramimonas_sp.AAC.1
MPQCVVQVRVGIEELLANTVNIGKHMRFRSIVCICGCRYVDVPISNGMSKNKLLIASALAPIVHDR